MDKLSMEPFARLETALAKLHESLPDADLDDAQVNRDNSISITVMTYPTKRVDKPRFHYFRCDPAHDLDLMIKSFLYDMKHD